ncbi:Bifunctional acetohydroxyacid reductoisomerase [Polyrhizophydium stewartii]|uniref:Acetohydroxy-acid reductoisomerase n=1 Tax=Polyrhizophydium stewartii TaxID=2732419 RepID=A0ABR4N7X1_9FUNG
MFLARAALGARRSAAARGFPGVLSRVSGILAGRGFNIESLVVARTEVADLSRMTIVLYGRDGQVEQARRQLEDIVPVWAVLDYTHAPVLEREILLAKVSTVPPELLAAAARRDSAAAGTDALERQAISGLAALFGAKIVDVTLEAVTVELSAKPRRIDAFVALLRPYGIVEAARSGAMAMARTPLARADPAAAAAAAAADAAARVPARGVRTLDFGGSQETVWERSDFPHDKLQAIFKDDVFAVVGYGTQGMAQSLNLRDNKLNVVVGVRKGGASWDAAIKDGWVPGKTLVSIDEACQRGTVIMNLLSDAGQKEAWPAMKPFLVKGKTLYFSHGFGVVYHDQTGIVPPKDVDVILAAPKGSGATVRSLFLEGRGINSSVAIFQDASGNARERAFALGVAIGSGYLYETTFQKEVFSDLTGERGVLMGAIQGAFLAQYEVLRARGHSPSEAFNETVEEATQSLYPLIGGTESHRTSGMDWMYAVCSTTARRGALDWAPEFHKATKPVFERLYESVANGTETRRTLEENARPDYRERLEAELKAMRESEMWRAGRTVRSLRPENQ